jgi:hypothetical protein
VQRDKRRVTKVFYSKTAEPFFIFTGIVQETGLALGSEPNLGACVGVSKKSIHSYIS